MCCQVESDLLPKPPLLGVGGQIDLGVTVPLLRVTPSLLVTLNLTFLETLEGRNLPQIPPPR